MGHEAFPELVRVVGLASKLREDKRELKQSGPQALQSPCLITCSSLVAGLGLPTTFFKTPSWPEVRKPLQRRGTPSPLFHLPGATIKLGRGRLSKATHQTKHDSNRSQAAEIAHGAGHLKAVCTSKRRSTQPPPCFLPPLWTLDVTSTKLGTVGSTSCAANLRDRCMKHQPRHQASSQSR